MNTPSQAAPTIIGVTGYAGAGKDTFARLLAAQFNHRGFAAVIVSSGDLVRQYVRDHRLGDPADRGLLQRVASEVMAAHGYDVWLEHSLAGLPPQTQVLLYPGLRHPDEVDFIHRHHGIAIGIDVPVQTRYVRSQARNRPGDNIDFEQFKINEQAERHGKGQQIEAVMAKIDVTIYNDGSLGQLTATAAAIAATYPGSPATAYYASAFELPSS